MESPLGAKDLTSPHVSNSKVSDHTARAGLQLFELSKLEGLLARTKLWIDTTVVDWRERRLLVAVWRAERCGLPVECAAYEAGLSKPMALLIWRAMLDRFKKHIGGAINGKYPFVC